MGEQFAKEIHESLDDIMHIYTYPPPPDAKKNLQEIAGLFFTVYFTNSNRNPLLVCE